MFLVGPDQTIMEKRWGGGGNSSVPVFKDIYSVETLVYEYLWREKMYFLLDILALIKYYL